MDDFLYERVAVPRITKIAEEAIKSIFDDASKEKMLEYGRKAVIAGKLENSEKLLPKEIRFAENDPHAKKHNLTVEQVVRVWGDRDEAALDAVQMINNWKESSLDACKNYTGNDIDDFVTSLENNFKSNVS